MAVPLASSSKGVTFGGFKRRIALLRVPGVALHDIFKRLKSKFIFVTGAILLHCFQKMTCSFSLVVGTALWRPPSSCCVASAALWTCGVACVVRIALSGLRQVVTTCKLRGRRGTSRECNFEWQAQHLVRTLRACNVSIRRRRSI